MPATSIEKLLRLTEKILSIPYSLEKRDTFARCCNMFRARWHSRAYCQRTGRSLDHLATKSISTPWKEERFRSRILFKLERGVTFASTDRTSSTVFSILKMKLHDYPSFRAFPSSSSYLCLINLSIEYSSAFQVKQVPRFFVLLSENNVRFFIMENPTISFPPPFLQHLAYVYVQNVLEIFSDCTVTAESIKHLQRLRFFRVTFHSKTFHRRFATSFNHFRRTAVQRFRTMTYL